MKQIDHTEEPKKPCYPILAFSTCLALSLCTYTTAANHFSINCGSTATSAALSGREWMGDHMRPKSSIMTVKGSSVASSVHEELWNNIDPVPYRTARVSTSQFSYSFHLFPGQKFIRLHFNPTSYYGDNRFKDLFTVEAGPFILLSNFSASTTAHALGHNAFTKEYCVSVQENQPLKLIFSPAGSTSLSKDKFYAFINGIEIISVPFGLSNCHAGDVGVQVVGQKSVIYIDNASALELVHRHSIRWDSDDVVQGMFGLLDATREEKTNKKNKIAWSVSVDVGFSYLVRLRFSVAGLILCKTARKNFVVTVNLVTVTTTSDVLKYNEDDGTLCYRSYMVFVRGHDPEAKRDILISLHSNDGLVMGGNGPLDGFDVFKLSNDANSLASSTSKSSLLTQHLPSQSSQRLLTLHGCKNSVAAVVIMAICLVNIIAYKLRENCEASFCGEENRLTTKGEHLCRRFSLPEMQSATNNFNDALVIGKGGFGNVYKGFIENKQQTVAIKRLRSQSSQGKREFWTEIKTLSELRHVNLVFLIGYCYEQKEMILVYDYIPSGSLADHLYKLARKGKACSPLSWKQRLEICIGAGRGLDYLHTGHGIIHRDIKTSNILLDENFVPKVSDFGLAKTKSEGELQRQASASVKGTFGYLDPNYFKTCVLTAKSDTFSFGVVLLEVLCGRPAVEQSADEDTCSLTKWAQNYISKGEVYQIVAPNIRDEISFSSLKTFVRIAERCLEDAPKKRPAIAHVLINLEFALEQQENVTPLPLNGITSVSEFFPGTDKAKKQSSKPLLNNMITNVTNLLTSPLKHHVTSPLKHHVNKKMVGTWKKDGKKNKMHNLLQIWPWDASPKTAKQSKQKEMVGVSVSEPLSPGIRMQRTREEFRNIIGTKLYDSLVFNFSELEAITRNFSTVIGEGGFGKVYKGWLDKGWIRKAGMSNVAVKRLSTGSYQGFTEWQNEVLLLSKHRHPNLARLLGYCCEDNELLLVYEYLSRGSLDVHIFEGRSGVEPLGWKGRLNILIGVARGLAFLHKSDKNIVHRDIKTSNILLDESYQAKIADFGLAKLVPADRCSHASTRVIGTYGYAAPDYVATGHLTAKSDAYSFGVVVLETITGLRVVDKNRPAEQRNLVEWMKPLLGNKRKMKKLMDPRLDGTYSTTCAFQVAQLAFNCLSSDPKRRPSLQEIVHKLESLDVFMPTPNHQMQMQ